MRKNGLHFGSRFERLELFERLEHVQVLKRFGAAVAVLQVVKRRAGCTFLKSWRPAFACVVLLAFSLVGAATIGTPPPVWKVGRAVFEWRAPAPVPGQTTAGQPIPVLKLSLRNEGGPGNLPVQIFGRWLSQNAPPPVFTLLATYQQQVALMQTAIVDGPLTALSKAPAGKLMLEISVTTGGQETDRKAIAWN